MDTTERMRVAATILRQLGGPRFAKLTGAKDFSGTKDSLMFRLPRARNGINKIVIRLDPSDTYTMTAYRINFKTHECEEIESSDDLYCDNLQFAFTGMTGLETYL